MHRAYSILHVKNLSEGSEEVTISGIATTPRPDRVGDIVDPLGAKFAEELPLMWQHRHDAPVGVAKFGKPTRSGIPYTARLPLIKEAGALKDRVDEAIQSMKYKLITGVSIGFRVLNDGIERLQEGGYKFTDYEVFELSLVTLPANTDATIQAIKSIDHDLLVASDKRKGVVFLSADDRRVSRKPGVTYLEK